MLAVGDLNEISADWGESKVHVGCTERRPATVCGDLPVEFDRPVEVHRDRWLSLALALATLTILGGCSSPRTIVSTSPISTVSADLAFASLGPGSPAVLATTQTVYVNATRQEIFLATTGKTPGENVLRVDVFGARNNNVGPETTLSDHPLVESDLAAEFEDALPGVPLRRSLVYVQNTYGPFGYATGRSAQGEACIYAWQRIATPDKDISLLNRRATISIRLRYCQPGASEAGLVAPMMGLQINAALSDGSWTPEPQHLSSTLGAPGAPIGPPAVQAEYQAAPAAPQPRRALHHIAPTPQQTRAAPAEQEPISGPIVPAPPAGAAPPFVPPPPQAVVQP